MHEQQSVPPPEAHAADCAHELAELRQQIMMLRRELLGLAQQQAAAREPATDLEQAKLQAYASAQALESQLAEPAQRAVRKAVAYVMAKVCTVREQVEDKPFVLVAASLLSGSVIGRLFCHGR